MNYALEVRGLSKSYKGIKVVDDLNIRVPEGQIYGFLGKNGAGKTTTIRMIMGLAKPDVGEMYVLGRSIKKDRAWAARIIGGIVDTPGFYENLSAKANLELTAEMYGVDKKRIAEVLDIVGLPHVGNKKARDFSLGMKQRLGIASALIPSPKILILDEPTNGLDPAGIKDMRSFLKNLSRSYGITILISSHILSEIQLLADCVGIIDKGRLIEETDVEAIKCAEQSCLIIEADNAKETERILKSMKMEYCIEQGSFRVFCKRDMNCQINKNLVQNDIRVFNLSSVTQSLEERFISITSDIGA